MFRLPCSAEVKIGNGRKEVRRNLDTGLHNCSSAIVPYGRDILPWLAAAVKDLYNAHYYKQRLAND